MTKAEILKSLTGKTSDQLGGTYKAKYSEMDELTGIGVLRISGPRIFPNLDACVKAQLQNFNAADQEIEDVIGQVLLKLG